MPQKVAILNVVGLSGSLLQHAPNISALGEQATLTPVLPAVTCSVQSSMLTGQPVSSHGVVGNGWFNHEQQEVQFWKQSNQLVHGEKVWETAKQRDPSVTCLNSFWWYNMYSSVDYSITPRPQYKADGRKVPDCYTHPASLRDELQNKLGQFPLFKFWGPMADIESTRWIADATMHSVEQYDPTLTLVYLPHLDYGLQKFGPPKLESIINAVDENYPDKMAITAHQFESLYDSPPLKDVIEVDQVAGGLIEFFNKRDTKVIVVSEYGIEEATGHIDINRRLRKAGLLTIRNEGGHELLDAGASDAFAVADHQVAHVYCKPGVTVDESVFEGCEAASINHERAGRYVLVANQGKWFTHDYWLDEANKPDFANCVDIHRKPGYDPRELFSQASMPAIAWKLAKKKMGFRQLMDVIPLDPSLVKGTHGRVDNPPELQPVMLGAGRAGQTLPCTAVRDVILEAMGLG
ncbi:MAG: alkaline phosphatase family protein [Phycisphaeraceae bacterium]|nr:alkaline phosphatase family protein [Phycisphaeraceae bacterium]